MKRFPSTVSTLSTAVITAAFAIACAKGAHAQTQAPTVTEPIDGALALPRGVTNIVSIDSQNVLLVETQDPNDPNAPKQYSLFVPRHTYSGGLSRIFGGSIISTETMVIPESAMRGGFNKPNTVTSIDNNNFTRGTGVNTNNSNGNFNNGNFGNGNSNNGNFSSYGNIGNFNRGNGDYGATTSGFGSYQGFPTYSPQMPATNINQLTRSYGLLNRRTR